MPSLIVIHGVGEANDESLRAAAANIAGLFPQVPETHWFYVNWNDAAADRILGDGEFRWRSVRRLFASLRIANQVGLPTPSGSPGLTLLARLRSVPAQLLTILFSAVIGAVALAPMFGVVSNARSIFSTINPLPRSASDLLTAALPLPAGLAERIMVDGLVWALMVVRLAALAWVALAAASFALAIIEATFRRSTAPLRIAIRQILLGMFGPLLVVLILPAYNLLPGVFGLAFLAAIPFVLLAPVLLLASLATAFVSFDQALFQGALELVAWVVGIGTIATLCAWLWFITQPAVVAILKVLLDIGLYVGDDKFRTDTHAAVDERIRRALDESTDSTVIVVGHSLGSIIALESLLTSDRWRQDAHVLLVTMGSPIRRFFWRLFPNFIFSGTPAQAGRAVAKRLATFRWINVYRPFDQIGSSLALSGVGTDQSTKQVGRFFTSHVNYWSDPVVADALRGALAATDTVHLSLNEEQKDDYLATVADGPKLFSTFVDLAALARLILFPLVVVAAWVWFFFAAWSSGNAVDLQVADDHAFFASANENLARAMAVGGSYCCGKDGPGTPLQTRYFATFPAIDERPVQLWNRTVGAFYSRSLMDFGAVMERVQEACHSGNCSDAKFEVLYDRRDPQGHYLIQDFRVRSEPTFGMQVRKAFISFVAASMGAAFVWGCLILSMAAGGIVLGVIPRSTK